MEGKILKLDNLGRGILYYNNKITFIPKTLPGDIVEFEITLEKKKYNEGKLLKVLQESQERIKPKCQYFSKCGGCSLQQLSYENTIKYKLERTNYLLKKHNISNDVIVIKNPFPFNYRNKITLKIIDGVVGFYEEDTHDIVEINNCLIAADIINKSISFIKRIGIKNGEVVLRSNLKKEVLVNIKSVDSLNISDIKVEDYIVGIILNNDLIYGVDYLLEEINNIKYKISYDSFFQVNPFIAQKLFKIIAENIENDDKVLDIYSGVGALSLNASINAASVMGIEIVKNAIDNANYNAFLNNRNNLEFILSDASVAATKIDNKFDTIIVDPPRNGLSKSVIDLIKNKKSKKVIYISCDQQTLFRDLDILKEYYSINSFYILDMFSYSYHVETVVILEKTK